MVGILDKLIDITRSREFLIFWIIFFVYTSNQTVVSSNDVTPTRLLPISIIRERNFDLDEFTFLYGSKDKLPYFLKNADGRILSQYPVFTSILAVPVYLMPVILGLDPQSNNVLLLSKLTATIIIAISALFIYWTIKRISNEKIALIITTIYAFGTDNWSISSQDLWQHGPGELFIAIAIYLLVRGLNEERFIKYVGFTLMCAVAVRPTNLIIAAVLTVYVLMEHRRQFLAYTIYATPIALMMLAYSTIYLNSILLLGQLQPPTERWDTPLLDGLLGLLISPNRGLLVYSPIFILSFIGMLGIWRVKNEKLVKYSSMIVFSMIVVWGKWWAWHGSVSYGPRMLIETIPFLCLLLAGPMEKMLKRQTLKIILATLVVMSIFINFIGAYVWDGSWEWEHKLEEKINKNDREHLNELWWSTSDMEWVYYAKRFLAIV